MKSSSGRDLFKVNAVTAGCLVALLASGAVQAQQQLDTVVVTGIRKGIEDAISVKKNKDSIVEAISAEDIGKLPDSSIAESIARLPGVTAQRVAGRASNISIRGMSGDFSTALLNGREQVSTGDNRGVEFDQYPSELLSGVVIYKTPDGELIGQGLSGTIDLQTVRPLNFKSRFIGANARKEKSGVGTEFEGSGKRFNFSYIDQFANRTFGVALGAARLQSEVTTGRKETYSTNNTVKFDRTSGQICAGWRSDDECRGFLSLPGANFETVTVNNGFKYFNDTTDQTRDGVMSVLQWKPNKSVEAVLDMYYSKFERDTIKRGLEIQVEDTWRGSKDDPRYPGWINPTVQGGRLISATWTNVNPLSRHIWEPRNDTLRSTGLNVRIGDGSGWTFTSDLSYSAGKRVERIVELEAGIPTPGRVTVSNYDQVTGLQFNYADPSLVKLMDPEGWGQNGYDKTIITDDKIQAGRLTASTALEGFFDRLNLGLNQSKREKRKSADEYFLRLPGGAGSTANLPAGAGGVTVGGTGGQFNAISFHPSQVYPSAYDRPANVNGDILRKGWGVSEEVSTAFAKATINSEFLGMPLRGNVGAQLMHTNQSSTAPEFDRTNAGGFRLRTDGKSYNDILPSANLVLELGNDQTVRLGAAKVLARARMDQLSANRSGEVGGDSKWSGGGGNAKLDPFRAVALDLSYEKYWGTKAYVSAAVFNKDLDSYIFDFTDDKFDFTGFINTSGRVPSTNIGRFTQPRNGKGGYVRGFELAASLPLDRLWKPLEGFGLVGSYANTKSGIQPFGDGDTRPLPGLSRKVSNLTVYYEAHGFQARVSNRKRSDFLGEIQGFGADREYTFIKGESIIDAQLGYEFQSGILKGLSALLQVNNLNNEAFQRYNQGTGQIIDTVKYGKTYLMGVTYKLQ
ncbi:TonB-dependent receptor [Inhella sp.]|uniref:TonB-dependent receptor n=1 Tax=Inhella sp. TaxID=1921806 RepID=UPI0035B488AF